MVLVLAGYIQQTLALGLKGWSTYRAFFFRFGWAWASENQFSTVRCSARVSRVSARFRAMWFRPGMWLLLLLARRVFCVLPGTHLMIFMGSRREGWWFGSVGARLGDLVTVKWSRALLRVFYILWRLAMAGWWPWHEVQVYIEWELIYYTILELSNKNACAMFIKIKIKTFKGVYIVKNN